MHVKSPLHTTSPLLPRHTSIDTVFPFPVYSGDGRLPFPPSSNTSRWTACLFSQPLDLQQLPFSSLQKVHYSAPNYSVLQSVQNDHVWRIPPSANFHVFKTRLSRFRMCLTPFFLFGSGQLISLSCFPFLLTCT